jgi:hypothetical protein
MTHVLLTRSPLSPGPKPWFSLDLHVLSAPPAFVLSQDQTLREETRLPTEAGKLVLPLSLCSKSPWTTGESATHESAEPTRGNRTSRDT